MKKLLMGATVAMLMLAGCATSPETHLAEAKLAAEKGNYLKAVVLAEDVASDSGVYAETQRLLPEWKRQALLRLLAEAQPSPSDTPAAPSAAPPTPAPVASVAPTDPAKISKVQANAREVQTMLETYGLDFNGKYPSSFAGLAYEAKKNKYWIELKNPLNPKLPAVSEPQRPAPGAVGYEYLGASKEKYHIHAWDGQGKDTHDKKGELFLVNGVY